MGGTAQGSVALGYCVWSFVRLGRHCEAAASRGRRRASLSLRRVNLSLEDKVRHLSPSGSDSSLSYFLKVSPTSFRLRPRHIDSEARET